MSGLFAVSIGIESEAATAALEGLDNRARKKALRPAVQAVAKLNLDAMKRLSPKTSGAFKRSLMVVTRKVKPQAKSITCLVGQRKQRKAGRASSAKANAKGSQITRAGLAAPIHFLDRSTKPHKIAPTKGRVIRFPGIGNSKAGSVNVSRSGRVTATRGRIKATAIFTRTVSHPGTSAQNLLSRAAHATRGRASAVFAQVIQSKI
jgi:hypothetical protein